MKKLLLATNNSGKVDEMRAILVHLNLLLLTPADLGLDLQVREDGETYAENASLKAIAFAEASGLTSLADDSGLEVDVLGGQPGLHSHRFAPWPEATDSDRRIYLLKKLQDKVRPWLAHFHASVALVQPGGTVRVANGECAGEIIPEERGTNGFGYDPIFFFPSLGHTMAELSMQEKNRLSHRASALRNAEGIISELLGI
ncbi:MAG: non-canonical purine NTP pyrophosphatase, RdgB/HAM1 family [Chloroflexi bacterium GWB2_49_20]|nr:MAG: non-canonical purine NTP pyrophosphatase, RdgB/HAM1 family [Chloroflexi bacterium GWB2_49_20]OGN77218.1 MAG: non-canonical purine NTP pyrophosphatase, RdgB/HAM1 family [Chloroflexi bacterium GWC2_49_37]OGN83944.1 MAG: non-canonical purine NTP pyrophosphatase, RdgB/HAM1 family [Chloroflexi bacterium GWD2_49_16]